MRRADVDRALEEQRLRGGRLCYHLMRLGKVTPAALFVFLQEHFGVIAPELLETLRTAPAVDLIPARLAHFYQMVPLERTGDRLLLALAAVDNPNLIPAVEEMTGLKVEPVICPPGLIRDSLARFFPMEDEPGVLRSAAEENTLILSDPALGIAPADPDTLPDDAPGVLWVRAVIGEAIRRRCREMLLEPLEDESRITFRQRPGEDGSRAVSRQALTALSLSLEELAKMPARGRTVPREGRFRLRQGERHLAVLVTWLPGLHGDGFHLRLMEERIRKEGLGEMLEDYPEARRALERALAGRKGLILVAAPEGHFRDEMVSALVDWIRWKEGRGPSFGLEAASGHAPPIRLLKKEGGTDLSEAIREAAAGDAGLIAALRIATREEAEALMEAGTRRPCVAGIRKQDALEAVQWLVQGGLLGRLREGQLSGVLGVRMAERICEHCRRRYDLLEEFHNLIPESAEGGIYFANAGCRACRGSGVLDLEPAFEFLPGSPPLADRIAASASPQAFRKEWTRTGMKWLYTSLLSRAAAGEVDVREPLRLLLEGRGAA